MLRTANRLGQRRLAVGLLAVVCLVCSCAAVCPSIAGAKATSLDARSAAKATRYYEAYLKFGLSQVPAIRKSTDAYLGSIDQQCPGVLAPENSLLQSSASAPVQGIGEEIEFDVELAGPSADKAYDTRFTKHLGQLRWTRSDRATVKNFREFITGSDALEASDLCTDMQAFVSDPDATPAGTATFDASALKVLRLGPSVDNFVKLLERYRTSANRRLFASILSTAQKLDKQVSTLYGAATESLLKDLGVSV